MMAESLFAGIPHKLPLRTKQRRSLLTTLAAALLGKQQLWHTPNNNPLASQSKLWNVNTSENKHTTLSLSLTVKWQVYAQYMKG